ncbi:MAG: hypothetical protein ACRDI2_16900 [Chloroflexota bacterium]
MSAPESVAVSAPVSVTGSQRLVALGLATFHTVGFVLILLVVLYIGGGLGSLLEGLNTAIGFVLFGALWATNGFCTQRALRRTLPASPASPGSPRGLRRLEVAIGQGVLWGGLNGVLFLLCLVGVLLVSLIPSVAAGGLDGLAQVPAAVFGFAIYAVLGAALAFVVGAIVGAVFGALDYTLLALAEATVRPAG